jgi:hypothetical protein
MGELEKRAVRKGGGRSFADGGDVGCISGALW